MRRLDAVPRRDWQKKVQELGLTWHSGAQPYWTESAFYELSAKDVEVLEAATNELGKMTLAAAPDMSSTISSTASWEFPRSRCP